MDLKTIEIALIELSNEKTIYKIFNEKEIPNNKSKNFTIIDNYGLLYYTNYKNIIKNIKRSSSLSWLKGNKYVAENIRVKSNEYGLDFIRINGEYKGNNVYNLVYRCINCGKEYITSWAIANSKDYKKVLCDECIANDRREKYQLSYDYVNKYITNYNCRFLDDKYINSNIPLKIECLKCNNKFSSTFRNFKATKHKCPNCAIVSQAELQKFDEDYVRKYIKDEGYKLLSDEYINCDTNLKLMCPKGHIFEMDFYHFKNRGQRCKVCFKLSGRSGENSGTWKGGITPLHNHLRGVIQPWKEDSFKKYNYKCDITEINGSNLVIHHHYNFSDILQETLIILNLPIYDKINKYSKEELKSIENKCLELHYTYGLGICICSDFHNDFHNKYGKKNNTLEQYREFKESFNLKQIK